MAVMSRSRVPRRSPFNFRSFFGGIGGLIMLGLLAWLVVGIVALFFGWIGGEWGFGFGFGWYFTLLAMALVVIAVMGVGLSISLWRRKVDL